MSEICSSDESVQPEPSTSSQCKRSRWNKANPEKWKCNVRKRKRNCGLPYLTEKNVEKLAKTPRDVNCNSCRFKCSENFTHEDRAKICSEYWKLGDYNRKKDFILKNVITDAVNRRRNRKGDAKHRSRASKFFFLKNGKSIRVCREFFLNTLAISNGPLNKAMKERNVETGHFGGSDKRGRHSPGLKTSEEDFIAVKMHIESFPVMESHFCRKSSKRMYLDSKLSIAKMYELYRNDTIEKNKKVVSLTTYRRIFGKEYNLSFFKPKKDQCAVCACYSSANGIEKSKLESEYLHHKQREKDANESKDNDKKRASIDQSFVTATFDLQSVLQIPSSDVSPMYYSRKLSCFNLTIYEGAPPNNAYCYTWTEINGKRGSAEIGTCLYKYLTHLPQHVKHVSFFSDTCGGQNRNQNVAAILLYFVQQGSNNIETIEHKFLESGHSMMECDSMHSAIESQKKYVSVYTMHDWLNIFRLARSKRGKKKNSQYIVSELKYDDFLDLPKVAKTMLKNVKTDTEGNKINWLKVKCFKYQKTYPNIIQYRYDHKSSYLAINVNGRGRPTTLPNLSNMYNNPLPISSQKYKDLLRLCETKVIPEEFHAWYKLLPVSNNTTMVDRAPEPAAESSSDDTD